MKTSGNDAGSVASLKPSRPRNIREVAALAGVSYATVSRVINNKEDVNSRTRKKILAIMEEHGFTPNYFARGLQKITTGVIGLVMGSCSEPTYAPILAAVDERARRREHAVMVSNSRLLPDSERQVLEMLAYRGVDGILLDPCLAQREFLEKFDRRVPLVLFNKPLGKKLDAFYINNFRAAKTLLAALAATAPAPFTLVTNPVEKEKKRGWRRTARELGLGEDDCRCLDLAHETTWEEFADLAQPPLRGTYVFTSRRLLGRVGALKPSLRKRAVLMSFDHVPAVEYREPEYPTCVFPSPALAQAALERLYEKIAARRQGRRIRPKQVVFLADMTPGRKS